MTVHFALRSRIRLHDERPRARTLRLPPLTAPIASYWALMGLLTYGVASGALRPERLASLRLVSGESFTNPRLSVVLPESQGADESEGAAIAAPTSEPSPAAIPLSSAEPPPSAPGPLAASSPIEEPRAPAPDIHEPPSSPKPPMRPLAGFSLGAPIQDDDGDRGSYAALAERDHDFDQSLRVETRERARDAPDPPRLSSHAPAAEEAPLSARRRSPLPNLQEPPARDVSIPIPDEFRPAARGAVAMRRPERRERAVSLRRADPADPYPGFRDDDDPAPVRREEPKDAPREAPEERRMPRPPPAPRSVSSCEAAVASANEEMDFTKSRGGAPDVTRGAYAALLEHGGYLLPCSVPAGTALDVCAAVRDGRAVGITVVTRPADARVAACVRNAVAAMAFPKSPRLDVTRTRFDASRAR